MKFVRRGVQPRDQLLFAQVRPSAEPLQRPGRGERRRRETIGEPLHAVASSLRCLFGMLGRHRAPSQDVEQLVGEVEMAATGGAFVFTELFRPDACLPPREAAFAGEPER